MHTKENWFLFFCVTVSRKPFVQTSSDCTCCILLVAVTRRCDTLRSLLPVLCCPMNRLVKVHTKDRVCYLANKNKKLSPRDRAMRRVSWNSSREWWHCPWSWVPPNYSKSPHFLHFAPPFIASWRVNLGSSNLGTLIYHSKSHPADGKSFLKGAWSGSGEPF